MVFVVMHVQANFLSGSRGFYKNIDKFGWVKYWQMIYNSPKFSPARILRYTVYQSEVTLPLQSNLSL